MFVIYSSTGEFCSHLLSWRQACVLICKLSELKPENTYWASPVLDI